jgi:glycosyltransferase involved in cell wall biosynthesis
MEVMLDSSQPLVSCVMPTADRHIFVPQAIKYFRSQDYPNKELVIVDDGVESVADLVPDDPQIRYIRLHGKRSLGAKRNECVEACHSELIMHWDDDDWMAPHRISYQVEALLREDAEVCGLQRMLFYDVGTGEVWLYQYPDNQCPWLAGGSLLYTRDFWRRSPFPNIQVASDTRFVWDRPMKRRAALNDYRFYVAMAHQTNTSPKIFHGSYWTRYTDKLEPFMGEDLNFYRAFNHHNPASSVVNPEETIAEGSIPTYSIIMVVHNALQMTRLSTLETLRRIEGQDARLVVVDNGSNDGSEQWLRFLAQRGDIDLIRNETNVGHGPAIELARTRTRSPYIVTLDSDAFPLCSDWLSRLRATLNGKVKVAGILHHRDYIHPSCLMIARETLDELKLSFLNEKDQPSQFDVAERISHDLKRRGFRIAGLDRTAAQRRGSVSEPVYLGSEYEGIVYHQWYTTRAATAEGRPVDDVPAGTIEDSLQQLFERHSNEARTVTVVMGIRAAAEEPQRLANAKICLQALNLQDLPRWKYRIIIVEQDQGPRLERELAPYVDKYIFVYNPGPYNRGWGFNVGACASGGHEDVLCLIDADLLVAPGFLQRGLQSFERGKRAVLPYKEVSYLDSQTTDRVIRDYLAQPHRPLEPNNYRGRLFSTSQGGCIFVASSLYHQIGGHDERFRGWGREDREFWDRLSRVTHIEQLPGRQLHLNHPRPNEEDSWATANQDLYDRIAASPGNGAPRTIGDRNLYQTEIRAVQPVRTSSHRREWENWHCWDPLRIKKIVQDEQRQRVARSNRRALAELLVGLGDSLLDAGCGPGAMWRYFENFGPRFSWAGADVTLQMLSVAHETYPSVPVCVTDAGNLPFRDRSFDVVLLRHVLEHLPHWLMEHALSEVMRVARLAVVVDFYVPPKVKGSSSAERVGENFLETCWSVDDLERPIIAGGWKRDAQLTLGNASREEDVVWILRPQPKEADPASHLSPKVSIIMPTYRRSHTLFRTIETIRKQTYRNWELIIIDNEGTKDYQFNEPRIRVYKHSERPSASYARNQGVKYATGDLVCYFDDDDEMFPSYLEMFVRAFEANPRAKMVRCGMIVSGGRTNFSYATPECCIRREFAAPNWSNSNLSHDQFYFKSIISKHGWSASMGDIITLNEALCQANCDPKGGLRSGRL